MSKLTPIATIVCAAALVTPLSAGGVPHAATQPALHLTLQQAIAAARRNAKPGSSFTVLKRIVATAETRRVGEQALAEAGANHIKLFEDGILADILRSGGFLLIQKFPPAKKVDGLNPLPFTSVLHAVSLGRDGVPKDVMWGPCINLADTRELARSTTQFVEQLYTTPSTDDLSLESRFYGGSFPEDHQFQGTLFAIPHSLQQLGANPNDVRKAAALYGGYLFWASRYALSMPIFAASPVAAENAAEDKRSTLKAEFLRSNHMDPHLDLDLDNIRNKEQLRERIELLTRLDRSLEDCLKKQSHLMVTRANLVVATLPMGVDVDLNRDIGHYGSSTPSMFMFFWQRLPTGGFAVKMITEADAN